MIWSVNSRDEEEKSSSSQDIYRGTFFPPMERGDRTRASRWCRPAGAGAGTAVRRAPRRPRRVRFKCMMTPDDLLEMETRMYVVVSKKHACTWAPSLFRVAVRVFHVPSSFLVCA